ncbi:MAG: hypothetical protein RIM23_12045 [Coleofasciculus sp. G3-WIS-01]|uniref:hypothetical protein n=1 Tax=Coleofasciculus sp. G3-WIS-01 TaxID=3069528 RepID=UPI0032F40950
MNVLLFRVQGSGSPDTPSLSVAVTGVAIALWVRGKLRCISMSDSLTVKSPLGGQQSMDEAQTSCSRV